LPFFTHPSTFHDYRYFSARLFLLSQIFEGIEGAFDGNMEETQKNGGANRKRIELFFRVLTGAADWGIITA
jgi:hypothetical protein